MKMPLHHRLPERSQMELELFPPNREYIDVVIQEEPTYIKIMSAITWSGYWGSLVAVAQVNNCLCTIALKEVRVERDQRTLAVRDIILSP